jgi:hypothetical protein
MRIRKNGSEIRSVGQWFKLAPPKRGHEQWVRGRSAYECARAWCTSPDGPSVPPELLALLKSCLDTKDAIITYATPEHRVRFDNLKGEPRNADLVIVAEDLKGRLAISIEAKADEPFDRYVRDILLSAVKKIAADQPTNSVSRIQELGRSILPTRANGVSPLGDLRYQLLTGVAGSIAFATEAKADRAIFIVHEFVTDRTDDAKHRANARDLDAFVSRLTAGRVSSVPSGTLLGPFTIPGAPLFREAPPLFLGKAVRDLRVAIS